MLRANARIVNRNDREFVVTKIGGVFQSSVLVLETLIVHHASRPIPQLYVVE